MVQFFQFTAPLPAATKTASPESDNLTASSFCR